MNWRNKWIGGLAALAFVGLSGVSPTPLAAEQEQGEPGAERPTPVTTLRYRLGRGAADKRFSIHRLPTPPVLDGKLDDPAWRSAAMLTDLHEVDPDEYGPPSKNTRIYIGYDDHALYVAARMFEDRPEDINAFVMRQGSALDDDRFVLMLDPFNKGRGGYIFELNAFGVRDDGLFQNTTNQNWDWEGVWQGRSRIDEQGWAAEMRIPFKTLSFDPDNDTWGINFARYATRQRERMGWMSRNRTQDPSSFGHAVGFQGISQGFGLDLVPGMALSRSRNLLLGDSADDFEPSLDAFYRISPAITAAVTVNTDFSGTAVDEVQVNLTRFGLFFPERRDFFLHDVDIFEFGRIGGVDEFDEPSTFSRTDRENGRPFFSRRVGLSESGVPVGIDYGGKLTGRIGRWDFGVLNVRQDRFGAVDPSNLFVGRAAMKVLNESSLGVILTNGHPTANLDNSLVGADFRYLNTRLPNGRTIEGAAWYQQSDTEGLAGKDAAYGFSLNLASTEFWRGALGYKVLEENFNPALGFVDRVGVRDYSLELGYRHRPGNHFIRSIYAGVDAQRFERLGGGLQSQSLNFRLLELENQAGDSFQLSTIQGKENVAAPFAIHKDIVVPPGLYNNDDIGLYLESGSQRPFSAGLGVYGGGFYGGDILTWELFTSWRPTPRYELGLNAEVNHVDLSQGKFITRLFRLRGDIAFSSTWSWENFAQYDNVSNTLGWNSTLRWQPEAGRELVLVFNYGAEDFDENRRFSTASTDLTFKISHTFRF